tara:strand:- start:344 stop:490 length:147 start_codon:yes stop_codon:yes gene_type:complete
MLFNMLSTEWVKVGELLADLTKTIKKRMLVSTTDLKYLFVDVKFILCD